MGAFEYINGILVAEQWAALAVQTAGAGDAHRAKSAARMAAHIAIREWIRKEQDCGVLVTDSGWCDNNPATCKTQHNHEH